MEIVCSLFKVCSRPHLHLLLFGDLRDKNKGKLLFIGGGGKLYWSLKDYRYSISHEE